MSKQLNIDEMLEVLQDLQSPMFDTFLRMVESLGTLLAREVADATSVEAGVATFQGTAFAGTCAPFAPVFAGQAVPDVLTQFDRSVDCAEEGWEPFDNMPHFSAERLPSLAKERLATPSIEQKLLQALKEIRQGAAPTGRWIDQITDAALDGFDDENVVPEGYYDVADPPKQETKGDDHVAWNTWEEAIEGLDKQEADLVFWDGDANAWKHPAKWEPYTAEEQSAWLETCVSIADAAIATATANKS